MPRGVHDIGGLPGDPVSKTEHNYAFWEKQVDALMVLLSRDKKLLRVDELRRGIESLDADAYNSLSYYERWIASISLILVEKGVLDQDALDAKIAALQAAQSSSSAKTS